MDLTNYEIWTEYQKADLKVKAEKTSSSHEKNGLYLHFLSHFAAGVQFSPDETYLLMDSLAETEQFFVIKPKFFTKLLTRSKQFFYI